MPSLVPSSKPNLHVSMDYRLIIIYLMANKTHLSEYTQHLFFMVLFTSLRVIFSSSIRSPENLISLTAD